MVGADRAHQLGLRSAADAGDLCPVCFRDLHGERPDASARSDDQDALRRRLNTSVVADRLQGGVSGDRGGGGLLEAHVVRLRSEAISAGYGVLGEGTPARPEHLVPRPKRTRVCTDRLDPSRHVVSEQRVLRRTDAEARQAHRVRHPGHQVPDALIDARCMHAHQHLTLTGDGLGDLPEPQNVDRAVGVPDDCLHRCTDRIDCTTLANA